jgi:hypothetical protein
MSGLCPALWRRQQIYTFKRPVSYRYVRIMSCTLATTANLHLVSSAITYTSTYLLE